MKWEIITVCGICLYSEQGTPILHYRGLDNLLLLRKLNYMQDTKNIKGHPCF